MIWIRSLWDKWFSWATISRWLLALCLWAVSIQLVYPTLDSLSLAGWVRWVSWSIIAVCAVALALRLFVPRTAMQPIVARCLFIGDVLALLFIVYGVVLNLNGGLDGSTQGKRIAVVTALIEEPFTPSRFLPAGRAVVIDRGMPDRPRTIAVQQHLFEYLLIGQEVSFYQYEGFFGMPWVSDFQFTHQAVPDDLLTSNDPIIKKEIVMVELRNRDWDRAVKDVQQYMLENEDDIAFAVTVSDRLSQGGQIRTAMEFLRPFASTRPTYEVQLKYAELLRQSGDIGGAIDFFRRAAMVETNRIDAVYQLGYILKGLGRFEEATIAFEKLLEKQPNYPNINEMLQEMRRQSISLAPRQPVSSPKLRQSER